MTQKVAKELEFKREEELIERLLEESGLGWIEGLSQAEKIQLNIDRQMKIEKAGWDRMSVEQLEDLLR